MSLSKQDLIDGLQAGLQVRSYMNQATMTVCQMIEYIDKNVNDYGASIEGSLQTTSRVTQSPIGLGDLLGWVDWHLNKTIPDLINHTAAVNRPLRLIRHKDTGAVYAWRAGDRPIFYHVLTGDELHFLESCGLSGGWGEVVDAETNLVTFLRDQLLRFAVDRSQVEVLVPVPPPMTYTVAAGDTLGAIASRFGVTVANLAAWNGIANPDSIQVGQVLVLSAPKA